MGWRHCAGPAPTWLDGDESEGSDIRQEKDIGPRKVPPHLIVAVRRDDHVGKSGARQLHLTADHGELAGAVLVR